MTTAPAADERRASGPRVPSVKVPLDGNRRLAQFVDAANGDERVRAWWHLAAVNSVRASINDHSSLHAQAVATSALTLLRLLCARGLQPDVVSAHGMDRQDAEVVVAAAAMLHDVGMAVGRRRHEAHSLALLTPKLDELLASVYDEPARSIMQAEILHAVVEHRSDGHPLTLEGDVVRVADALDMTQARSVPTAACGIPADLDALSVAAIATVHIGPATERAVRIEVSLTDSAGLFQLDQRFAAKLRGSRLEEHIELVVEAPDEPELVVASSLTA